MKRLIILLFAAISLQSFSQVKVQVIDVPSIETVFNRGIYQSFYSYSLQEPVYVKYELYKGGGACNRSKFRFINDTGLEMMDNPEYTSSGYDRGHLANAEDFAYDCVKDELTFRYYNCLPQTPNMNRGVWKSWETKIRQESQSEKLIIVTGGIWGTRIHKTMRIPDYCWKVVQSSTTGKVLHVLLFTNLEKGSTVTEISLPELEKRLGYKLPLSL